MEYYTAYTDGACLRNPGRGGWGAVIIHTETQKSGGGQAIVGSDRKQALSGSYRYTTNNRMELLAVIEALAYIPAGSVVEVYSDSTYVVDAINRGWLPRWKELGWRSMRGDRLRSLKNVDLWKRLDALLDQRHKRVTVAWVKGHAGHPENNEADRLAGNAARHARTAQRDEGYEPRHGPDQRGDAMQVAKAVKYLEARGYTVSKP